MSSDRLKKIFRRNLINLLESRGKSQLELAKYLDVSPTTVNNWIKGYNMPRMDKVDDICKFFNIRRSQLIGEGDPDDSYYLDPEVAQMAQDLQSNPDLRLLFRASQKVAKDDIEKALAVLDLMKKEENGG